MKILITGANGFIGKNLSVALRENASYEVLPVIRETPPLEATKLIADADAVIHLAGVNRPEKDGEFVVGNADYTAWLCSALRKVGRPVPVAFASSIQAELDNPYGASKRLAEKHLDNYAGETGAPVAIYRLPNVFGKWCRPNYNSAVATFCHNIARGLPVRVDDPQAALKLVYIDDVVRELINYLHSEHQGVEQGEVTPVYSTTVGALVEEIEAFRRVRDDLVLERVGTGLVHALYATYVSFLPTSEFSYEVPGHPDSRGVFVEFLKTQDSGQFSVLTAHLGVTRGGHYHHSKVEKFLVIRGTARFKFRHIVTNEVHELTTSGEKPEIVESIPGWSHDITNVGEEELVAAVWANEIFDPERPDTVKSKV